MIPIKLEIQGLYSYREKQVIEFESLTAAGLFGIFGAVGSGKSSILEGILLALYASTERLADRGERTSMLNLQSDMLLINFEFKAGRNNTRTILARYTTKRNPKNIEELQTAEHTFYEKIGSYIIPITERAEELIGMKKEHFKQTVIIPQGKFKEFLDLKPAPRAEMMKELFGLERFDLGPKTTDLQKIVREMKIRLETQLQGLQEYSSELLVEKKSQLKKISEEVNEAKILAQTAEKEYRENDQFRTQHNLLQELKAKRKILQLKAPQIEVNRILHADFIKAKTYLKPVYDQREETSKDLEKYKTSVINCERVKIRFKEEIATLESEENELKEKSEKRPQRESKIRDLKKVLEIQKFQHLLNEANTQLETLKPTIETKKKNLKTIQENLKKLEQESEKIPVLDSQHLAYLQATEKDWRRFEESIQKLKIEIDLILDTSKKIDKKIKILLNEIPKEFEHVEKWMNQVKNDLKTLESEWEILIQKQGFSAHMHLLHKGESCPLCGATEHPNPLRINLENGELNAKKIQITSVKEEIERIAAISKSISEQEIHAQNNLRNLNSKESEYKKLTFDLSQIQAIALTHQLPTIKEVKEKITLISQQSEILQKLEFEIKTLRKEGDQQRENLSESETILTRAYEKINMLETSIKIKKEEIKDLEFCESFFTQSLDAIQKVIAKVEKDIQDANDNLIGKQKHLHDKREDQITNDIDLKHFNELKKSTAQKLEKLNTTFELLKIEHQFQDESYMIQVFESAIDAENVLKEINEYDQQIAVLADRIEELACQKNVLEFNEEEFLAKKESARTLKLRLAELQNKMLLLSEEIKNSSTKLIEKLSLEKTFESIQTRETYLKELESLFKGSGFVKYVSSIYLKELCNTANLRFMKLTKNSLSLEIDHENTFWVIDYLNGGKKRLLKTLSGGQTFQASLCLALALAEKVKALNQNDQSFFFLDEGFGALDRNSLRVVFETLKSLRFENRIVGIISHVEELQQEIGVYAKVELDPDHGSVVHYSY